MINLIEGTADAATGMTTMIKHDSTRMFFFNFLLCAVSITIVIQFAGRPFLNQAENTHLANDFIGAFLLLFVHESIFYSATDSEVKGNMFHFRMRYTKMQRSKIVCPKSVARIAYANASARKRRRSC